MKKLLLATLLITSPVMADVSDEKYLATLDAHMKQARVSKETDDQCHVQTMPFDEGRTPQDVQRPNEEHGQSNI